MRSTLSAVFVATLLTATAAQAEKRIFIVANSTDGYGVDRCLADGSNCGQVAAAAYCQSKQFTGAVSFRKIDRDEITGAVPVGNSVCGRGSCEEFIAIECTR
jgi:hypothetical protein